MYINAACLSSTGASRPCYDVQNKPGNAYASRRRCRLGPPITLAPEDAKENIWSFYPEITLHTHDTHFLPPPFSLNHIIFLSSQQETTFISLSPICQKALYFFCENKYPIVVRFPGGGVQGGHAAPSCHSIIFHHHLIIHLHPPSHHPPYPFHVSISHIILQLHFSTHPSYHSSPPFFLTSCFSSKRFVPHLSLSYNELRLKASHYSYTRQLLPTMSSFQFQSCSSLSEYLGLPHHARSFLPHRDGKVHCAGHPLRPGAASNSGTNRVIQLPKQRPVVGNLICGYDSLLVASFSVIGPLNLKKNTWKSR